MITTLAYQPPKSTADTFGAKHWRLIAAGLTASAWMSWIARPRIAPRSISLPAMLVFAALYVALVLFAGVVIFVLASLISKQAELRRIALPAAASGVWLAPLLFFLFEKSLWAIPAMVALIVAIINLFDDERDDTSPTARLFSAVCSAGYFQIAGACAIAAYPKIAALMAGVGTVVLMKARPDPQALSLTKPRTLSQIAIAFFMTVIAFLPFLKIQSGADFALFGAIFGGNGDKLEGDGAIPGQRASDNSPAPATSIGEGQFAGIILLPDKKGGVLLLPPPPSTGRSRSGSLPPKPTRIPFYGQYWFFQAPFERPPHNSHRLRGETTKLAFRAVNGQELLMEAHQNFGMLLDLACCRGIDLEISDAEPVSETILVELVLNNTFIKRDSSLSLSMVSVSLGDPTARKKTLHFTVPSSPSLNQFDEAIVQIHRTSARWARSAKIAIESFILVP